MLSCGRFVRPLLAAAAVGIAFAARTAWAAETTANTGDTAWVIAASALVLFMTLPGLALFYGGLVRARNVLSVLMHCFIICCIVSILWALGAYSLSFNGANPWIGDLSNMLLGAMAPVRDGTTVPEVVYVMFQMTFAIITPGLIIGAFPERVTFRFIILFTPLWLLLVYVPAAHWVWGGGWLAKQGVLDFAGGIVVHTTAGVSALVTALMIGPRKGFPTRLVPPHSPSMTMAGAGMLWVGWFGFNGGSALAANVQAGSAILVTQLAASVAAIAWIGLEWIRSGKPTSVGIVTGAVAGLATITPGSGYVGPIGGLLTGLVAGIVCYTATLTIKQHFKCDDSLDVFAVHGVGGMIGSLLLAIFAIPALGGAGFAGTMTWVDQLGAQALGVGAVAVWSGALTYIIVRVIGIVTPLRVSAEHEYDGLDLSLHGERAYDYT